MNMPDIIWGVSHALVSAMTGLIVGAFSAMVTGRVGARLGSVQVADRFRLGVWLALSGALLGAVLGTPGGSSQACDNLPCAIVTQIRPRQPVALPQSYADAA